MYSVKDICARYQVKAVTARKYMREMEHIESPLMVTERAVRAWEFKKTEPPASKIREILKRKGGMIVGSGGNRKVIHGN